MPYCGEYNHAHKPLRSLFYTTYANEFMTVGEYIMRQILIYLINNNIVNIKFNIIWLAFQSHFFKYILTFFSNAHTGVNRGKQTHYRKNKVVNKTVKIKQLGTT